MAGMLGKKEVAALADYLEQQEGVRIRPLGPGGSKGGSGGGWFAQFPDGSATGIHLSTSDSNGHHNIRRIMKQNGIEWPFDKGAARAPREAVMTMTGQAPGIITEGYPKYLLNRNPGSTAMQRIKEEALRLMGEGRPVTQAAISAQTGMDPASVNQALYQQGFRWMTEKAVGGADGRNVPVRQWTYVEGAEVPFTYKRRPPKSDDGRMEAFEAQQQQATKTPDLAEQEAALLTTVEEQHLTPIQHALLDAVRNRKDKSEPAREAADRLITAAAIPPEQKAALRAEVDTIVSDEADAEPERIVAETVTEPPLPAAEPIPAITEADLDAATALAAEAEERARAAEARATAAKAEHDRLMAEWKAAQSKFEQSEARNLTLQRNLEDAARRHRAAEETLRASVIEAAERAKRAEDALREANAEAVRATTQVVNNAPTAADDSWVVTPEPEQALQALIDQAGGLGLEVEVRVRRKR